MPKRKDHTPPEGVDISLSYRATAVMNPQQQKPGMPTTMDEDTRSVEMVGATEQAVTEFDWDRWEYVPTILRMDGCRMPANGQLPLLDTHMRFDTSCVIGSFRDCRIEGEQFIGRACFSSAPEAEGPYLKMKEGHLTDCSIARKDNAATFVPEGQTGIIGGRSYPGPLKVVTDWTPKEMSICPIGADTMAKARAATAHVTPNKESKPMNEQTRKFLESRGLPATATEEEAYRFLETLQVPVVTAPAAAGGQRSDDEIRAEAVRSEQARIADIRGIASRAGFTEDETGKFISGNTSVEDVRRAAFDKVTAVPQQQAGFRAEVGSDARDKFRTAAEGSLIIRAGGVITDEILRTGARDLAGFTLIELARESLRQAGQSVHGNILDVVGRSFTTSDFPLLLANVANKSLMEGWDTQEETWPVWVAEGSVSDFKTNTIVRPGEVDSLDEIGEDDEYKYGTRTEQQEQYKIATYGKLFKISRQTIINDDLGALTDIPREHGEAATRTVGDVVYAVLTANANMGDNVALFHAATHKNLAGSGAVVGVDTLGTAEAAMGLQKDIGGKRRLNIKPVFFLCPLTKKTAAEQFFTTPVVGTQASPNVSNIYSGAFFTRVYEPRLDDNSTTAWYLAARKGKTVKVFFLNGNKTPFLDTKQGWNTDGVEFKVRIDCGAKALSWKGLYKNPGA